MAPRVAAGCGSFSRNWVSASPHGSSSPLLLQNHLGSFLNSDPDHNLKDSNPAFGAGRAHAHVCARACVCARVLGCVGMPKHYQGVLCVS